MRTWTYSYKTSDGLRHEAEMSAPTKDDVYAALRERGIRAIKVTERIQPVIRKGWRGLRKRDITCIVLCALCLAGFAWYMATRSVKGGGAPVPVNRTVGQSNTQTTSSGIVQLAQPRPRKWLDLPADLDIARVFRYPHERFLAQYAMPGTGDGDPPELTAELVQDFYDNLNAGVLIEAGDAPAVAELKRIVAGMKDDAKKYLGVPDGIDKLAASFATQCTMEREYRARVIADVGKRKGKSDYSAAVEAADRLLELGGFEKTGLNGKGPEK